MSTRRWFPGVVLVLLGASWGFTIPMTRLAVSTGYQQFGLIAWQLIFSSVLLFGLTRLTGRRLRFGLRHLRLLVVLALMGTLIPNSFSYIAAVHLPAGVMAIIISLVPMFALPVAILWGMERFQARRFAGILLGAIAVLVLVAPQPGGTGVAFGFYVLVAMLAPLCYGVEGNYVARFGLQGLDPIETLLGASLLGLVIIVPLALATGQWVDLSQPWGRAEWALLISSLLHGVSYSGYVWLVGRAGSVFASQVAYWVTGFGVFWALVILSESYSGWIWAALGLMLAGLFLVQPRGKAAGPLEAGAKISHTEE
jgi:drug/metabolite transporter (DMT)-like permease